MQRTITSLLCFNPSFSVVPFWNYTKTIIPLRLSEYCGSWSIKPFRLRAIGLNTSCNRICPLHDSVTWCKITYTGEQVAQWDFQNKGRCIVLEIPLCHLLISMCDFVPCDRVVQRTYSLIFETARVAKNIWRIINNYWMRLSMIS